MTGEFVHTGQTLTGGGDAYCPLERKRRGPAALAAALTVLLAGGVFLVFSAISEPQRIAETPIAATLPVAPETAPAAPVEKAAAEEMTVAEALAESRAARAGRAAETERALAGGEETADKPDGLVPHLKPVTTSIADGVVKTAGVAPSLKPAAPAPKPVAPPSRPMQLGGVEYASADDQPPPFFFASDIVRHDVSRTAPAVALAADLSREPQEFRIRINRGENFVDALKRAGVSPVDANEAAYAFGEYQNLRRLLPGQELALTLGWQNQTLFELASAHKEPQAQLLGLEFRADPENRILLRRAANGEILAEKKTVPLTTRVMSIAGQINGSLYLSAKHVGAPDQIIADLADAFSYDVDFQREIFGGDEFEAIFEVNYDDRGKMVSVGDILYARLKWRGRSREKGYYRFSEDGETSDFYDATGQSARRLLMKTPIDGARLSSGFGTRRHPILGYRRAHKGVDFAAPRGTPIKAAGDGVIERANRYGSFGNYVRIRHANGYQTAYAHLKGFARGIRAGKRVRQGDIIAYVGTTGRSTGPHLHYEVHLHGKAVNPQRLKIKTTGKKLQGEALDRFKMMRAMIDAMRMPPEEREALYARQNSGTQGAL
ncbi:peptidoglycan DD-metalloendopeptidase family protein [Hyphococcus luteus]|uniref:Peptidase M23 n=1 Tax=Hyphococcus luteus TaxID=2058213 RepID=A0A2S7KAD6_9PROT|nr:peptidoglycan DD-metalloendopeptidase family protein [Marinicaulis flavus]PQA89441.1 peptidase M23 [Marinicaulis flavus]